jgi:hypothetical protein
MLISGSFFSLNKQKQLKDFFIELSNHLPEYLPEHVKKSFAAPLSECLPLLENPEQLTSLLDTLERAILEKNYVQIEEIVSNLANSNPQEKKSGLNYSAPIFKIGSIVTALSQAVTPVAAAQATSECITSTGAPRGYESFCRARPNCIEGYINCDGQMITQFSRSLEAANLGDLGGHWYQDMCLTVQRVGSTLINALGTVSEQPLNTACEVNLPNTGGYKRTIYVGNYTQNGCPDLKSTFIDKTSPCSKNSVAIGYDLAIVAIILAAGVLVAACIFGGMHLKRHCDKIKENAPPASPAP